MVQRDRYVVTEVGELFNVFIRLSSNPVVTQMINIYVVDIPDVYGMLLSRDWLEKLHAYFTTYYSHLWFPYKGKENQIRIDREPYVKHVVTGLGTPEEVIPFRILPHANYYVDTFFRYFQDDLSPLTENL